MINSDPASSSEPVWKSAEGSTAERVGTLGVPMIPSASRLMAIAIAAGIAAGIASWLMGEALVNAFRPPYQVQHVMGQTIMKATFKDQSAADMKNATLAFAMLGGLLGAALGVAGGLARRSAPALILASLAGVVLGGLLAAGASATLLPLYFNALERDEEQLSQDLTLPLLVHGGIWAACGLAGGLTFGIGMGAGRTRTINAGLGGLIGAVLGAVLYELVAAMALPTHRTTSPLATSWEARLLARLLVATLSAILAAVLITMRGRRAVPAEGTPATQVLA